MGIPLRDLTRSPLHRPVVTISIIVANVVVFLCELVGGDAFIRHWSAIPVNIVSGHDWITIVTSTFMHAGWMHIIGNMVFFWVFGIVIEDSMGPFPYLTFYLLSGIAASLAEIMANSSSAVPGLGASGAIAGVMGAFVITYPGDRIRTLLLFGWFSKVTVLPASLLIGLWFLLQLAGGVGSIASVHSGGVAYMAHVGGFVFGLFIAPLFIRFRRIAAQAPPEKRSFR